MVSTNQMKKEAVEVRKMIAASRLAKKQAAAKERKLKKKTPSQATPAAELTEKEKAKLRMRKGVLITKADLLGSNNNNNTAAAATSESTPAKKGKKQSQSAKAVPPVVVPNNAVEPPYNYEVHHKNAQVTIRVTLHKVPPSTIDISQTTPKTFVLQTPKFTKKFYLSFDFPGGLEVVPANAEYTFDTGVLTCVLPIKNGVIPAELAEERDAFLKKVTTQKAMRFRVGKEGELVVRTRQALLPADMRAAASKKTAEKKATAATPATTSDESATAASSSAPKEAKKEVSTAAVKKTAPVAAAATGKKALEAAKKAAAAVAKTMTYTPEGQQAAAAKNAPKQQQGPSRKQFVNDGAAMLAMAEAAGAAVKNKLYENLQKAKELQTKKVTRMAARQDKSQVKKEKQEMSFMRVLAEQKRMLAEKMKSQQPVARPKTSASTKQVKFA